MPMIGSHLNCADDGSLKSFVTASVISFFSVTSRSRAKADPVRSVNNPTIMVVRITGGLLCTHNQSRTTKRNDASLAAIPRILPMHQHRCSTVVRWAYLLHHNAGRGRELLKSLP